MISEKDVQYKTILFLNASKLRMLSIRNGELLITDPALGETLTKLSFKKILAIFVIGNCTVSSAVIDAIGKHAVPLCLLKESLRPVIWKANPAEGNYLLRRRQHLMQKEDIGIARILVTNKISNSIRILQRYPKNEAVIRKIEKCIEIATETQEYRELMSAEATAAKLFLTRWFQTMPFSGRKPRMKCDPVNVSLDIGYTVLFNYIEANLRLFGFDLYVGVYHRLFFQRKSLVCDVMEPFRCIVDLKTKDAFKTKEFKRSDFMEKQGIFSIKKEKAYQYYKAYAQEVILFRMDIFRYVRDYYRAFMRESEPENYPKFLI